MRFGLGCQVTVWKVRIKGSFIFAVHFAFVVVILVIQDAYEISAFPCLINGILTQHVSEP